jgi:hypothetical protein
VDDNVLVPRRLLVDCVDVVNCLIRITENEYGVGTGTEPEYRVVDELRAILSPPINPLTGAP